MSLDHGFLAIWENRGGFCAYDLQDKNINQYYNTFGFYLLCRFGLVGFSRVSRVRVRVSVRVRPRPNLRRKKRGTIWVGKNIENYRS